MLGGDFGSVARRPTIFGKRRRLSRRSLLNSNSSVEIRLYRPTLTGSLSVIHGRRMTPGLGFLSVVIGSLVTLHGATHPPFGVVRIVGSALVQEATAELKHRDAQHSAYIFTISDTSPSGVRSSVSP